MTQKKKRGAQQAVVMGLFLIAILGVGCSQNVQPGPTTDPTRVYWQDVFESLEAMDSTKDLVLAEVPSFNDPNLSECQRVELLRHWTAQQIDYAGAKNDCLSDSMCHKWFCQSSADRLIAAFREDKIAVYCGGSAVTLRKLYQDFGYHALEINMGVQGTFTHMVTLVEVECDGRKLLSVQDPYLDTSYCTADGRLLDYFEMLTLLKQGRHDSVIPTNPEGVMRDSNLGPDPEGGGPKMIRRQMSIELLYISQKALTSAGCPAEPVYVYLLPFDFYAIPREEAEALLDQVHNIVGDRPCAPAAGATPDTP